MCHIAQNFSECCPHPFSVTILTFPFQVLIGALQHGTCTVQPTKIAFSSEELVDMIQRCGLNHLSQFSTFLSSHLRNARLCPKLLEQLRSLSEIIYSGLPLHREDEEYAYRNALKIKVRCTVLECKDIILNAPLTESLRKHGMWRDASLCWWQRPGCCTASCYSEHIIRVPPHRRHCWAPVVYPIIGTSNLGGLW